MSKPFEVLKAWVIQNHGYVHPHITLCTTDPSNRYMISTEPLASKEKLINIPSSLCIKNEKSLGLVKDEGFKNVESEIELIYRLIEERKKGEQSFFYPYLQCLPTIDSFYSHPLYIAFLNPSILEQWSRISVFSNNIKKKLYGLHQVILFYEKYYREFSLDEVIYYFFIIMTRAWNNFGLVPIADLFQHSNTSMMFLNDKDSSYYFQVDKDYPSSSILYDNYGIIDDNLLFCTFGFLDSVENDSILRHLSIAIPFLSTKPSILEEIKKMMMEKNNFGKQSYYLSSFGLASNLLGFLRIKHLLEEDIHWKDQWITGKEMISLPNEKNVLLELVSILLDPFNRPTSEQLELSNKIIKSYPLKSVEYHLAKLTLIHDTIMTETLNMIRKYWLSFIGLNS